VFESHHAENWRMEMTTHDFLKVVFVLQGNGWLHSVDDRTACERGDALVVPVGLRHRLEDADGHPMSLYVLSIRRPVYEVAALDPAHMPSGLLRLGSATGAKVESGLRRLLFEQTLDQPHSGALVVSIALRLLSDLQRVGQHSAPGGPARKGRGDSLARMRAYVEELDEHFFEATNLDEAAASLGISRRRFTQLFRKVTGTSWLAYVRRMRVEHAKRLLERTDRTVLSIAFECGFEDLSTFYRAFKREVDESPNHWRSTKQSAT